MASQFKQLNYSLKQVDRAGDTLSGRALCLDEQEAWQILDNWRAAHHLPLQYIANNLERRAKKLDKAALTARRLKRAPSIFSKLEREQQMVLSRMQDIGGCRAIMPSLDKVKELNESFQKSRQNHNLLRVKDYIANPKSSGYRGIHLIYKFQSSDEDKSAWNGRSIEVQIRSFKQHMWATAVEIVGMMTGSALKSSSGLPDWLRFFSLVSEAFALLDQQQLVSDELCRKITKLERSLGVHQKLTAYSLALENTREYKVKFYLLVVTGKKLNISGYPGKPNQGRFVRSYR